MPPGQMAHRGCSRVSSVPTVRVSNTLRSLCGGRGEISVAGDDLAAVLAALEATHPGFDERLMREDGRLRGFVNVFVDDTECRRLAGLATPVGPNSVVSIVPAVAGG